MKCQNMFYWKKVFKKNVTNLSSAKLAHRVVKVQLDSESVGLSITIAFPKNILIVVFFFFFFFFFFT